VPVTSRLLKRQLRSHFPGGEPSPGLEGLLEAVDESYRRFETGHALLERSLELSSDELLQANAELRGMLRALPDLFITLDADGRILSYRPPAGPDAMKTDVPDDVVGRSIVDIAPAAMQDRFREALERMRAGSAQEQLDYTIPFEGEVRHRDARFVRLPEGHALCIVRDVTDLQRAEEALRCSEEHYRLLFDANPQPMWVFDRETFAFLAVNQAAVDHYGWSRDEFLAMTAGRP
jgi:PAS domain-containing protein